MRHYQSFRAGWAAIDQSAEPSHYIRLMDAARKGNDGDPAQYRKVFDELAAQEGETILDVGCGTGGAVRALASQVTDIKCVTGIDYSDTMIAEAEKRSLGLKLPIEYRVADAQALPFDDHTFDRCYTTGVFEILPDPRQALAEMVRVTRPGGRLVLPAPDTDGSVIDAADREVTRKLMHYICDYETNGWFGRQLPGYARELGLIEMKIVPSLSLITDFALAYEFWFRQYLEGAQRAGVLSTTETADWLADQEARHRAGRFLFCWASFLVVARKPPADASTPN